LTGSIDSWHQAFQTNVNILKYAKQWQKFTLPLMDKPMLGYQGPPSSGYGY